MNFFLKKIIGRYVNIYLLIAVLPFGDKTSNPVIKTATNIVFIENSWDEALKQAKIQHKYIFVDAYTSWCGPCKMLKQQTFTDSKVAAFFNANFINVSIDIEKGQGPKLASNWHIESIPTLIVFDAQGKPLLETVGFVKANDFLRFGKEALTKK